jgi:hypothetical protein
LRNSSAFKNERNILLGIRISVLKTFFALRIETHVLAVT